MNTNDLIPLDALENILSRPPAEQVRLLENAGFACDTPEAAAEIIYRMMEAHEAMPECVAAEIQDAINAEARGAAIPRGMVDRWLRPDGTPTTFWNTTRLSKRVRSAWTDCEVGDKVLEQVNEWLSLTPSSGGESRALETYDDALAALRQAQAFYRTATITRKAARDEQIKSTRKDKTAPPPALPPNTAPRVAVNNAPPEHISHNGRQWAVRTRAEIADNTVTAIINGKAIELTATPVTWSTGNTGHRLAANAGGYKISGSTAVAGYKLGRPSQTGVHMISLWLAPV